MELYIPTDTFGGEASTRKCRQKVGFKWFPELSQKHHLLALAVFTIPMTVFSSHLLYNWVEKPGIRWGSKLAKKF